MGNCDVKSDCASKGVWLHNHFPPANRSVRAQALERVRAGECFSSSPKSDRASSAPPSCCPSGGETPSSSSEARRACWCNRTRDGVGEMTSGAKLTEPRASRSEARRLRALSGYSSPERRGRGSEAAAACELLRFGGAPDGVCGSAGAAALLSVSRVKACSAAPPLSDAAGVAGLRRGRRAAAATCGRSAVPSAPSALFDRDIPPLGCAKLSPGCVGSTYPSRFGDERGRVDARDGLAGGGISTLTVRAPSRRLRLSASGDGALAPGMRLPICAAAAPPSEPASSSSSSSELLYGKSPSGMRRLEALRAGDPRAGEDRVSMMAPPPLPLPLVPRKLSSAQRGQAARDTANLNSAPLLRPRTAAP